jgi:hypothetical protein
MNPPKEISRQITKPMNTLRLQSLLAIFALILCPTLLHAQATRTWVSGVGDDANPCSRTAPCKTFAGAISKTVAGGEIDVLDPGGFGTLTTNKAITVYGDGSDGSILGSGTNGINIAAGATDVVVLRNLNLNGDPGGVTGINITGGLVVVIEDCVIGQFTTGINFTPSTAGAQLIIKNTTFENCSGTAVNLAPTAAASVSIVHCNISDCGEGIAAAPKATVDVTDTVAVGLGGAGFLTTASGAIMTLTRCTAFDDGIGVESGGTMVLNDCAVLNNAGAGLKINSGATLNTFSNNSVTGNNPDGAPVGTIPKK